MNSFKKYVLSAVITAVVSFYSYAYSQISRVQITGPSVVSLNDQTEYGLIFRDEYGNIVDPPLAEYWDWAVWHDNDIAVSSEYSCEVLWTVPGDYEVEFEIHTNDDPVFGDFQTIIRFRVTVLNEHPDPVIAATNSGIIGDGSTVTLTVDNYSYDSYQWSKNGTPVSGATSSSLTTGQTGVYQVTVAKGSDSYISAPRTLISEGDAANMNYVVANKILVDGVTNTNIVNLPVSSNSKTTQYFDGLGRLIQSVVRQGSPQLQDIVQPVAYDQLGRETKKYLPYVDGNNGLYKISALNDPSASSSNEQSAYRTGQQFLFYQDEDDIANDRYPLSVTLFDNSPLNRVVEQGAPGEPWQPLENSDYPITNSGYTIKTEYLTNEMNEVWLWIYTESAIGSFGEIKAEEPDGTDLYYDLNELFVTKTSDEEYNPVYEYKDKAGRILLKKTSLTETYYVYDDFGNLRAVIPPEGVKRLKDNNIRTPDAGFLSKWSFLYLYDKRHRMIGKKVPGAKWVYMVYDKRDRLILTQDGNQRSVTFGASSGREWTFTKYDALNRPVMTGIYTHSTAATLVQMQSHVDGQIVTGDDFYESFDGSTGNHGYTNRVFPTSNIEILTVTYYDNYQFRGQSYFDNENLDFSYKSDIATEIPYPASENQNVKGFLTGSKVKALDPQNANQYLNMVSYYDDRYRVIQTINENHLGGREITTSCYNDLTGNVKESVTLSEAPVTLNVHRKFTYDHAQRLLAIQHSINGESFVTIASNEYNELGQLISKKLNKQSGGTSWQTVDYKYNIRGWLTGINDTNLSDAGDLFGMELCYNAGFEVGCHNGNISGIKWKTAVDEDRLAYGYRYDRLNRITSAHFVKGSRKIDGTFEDAGLYNLEITPLGETPGYDLNGNIQNLKRYGVSNGVPTAIDLLTYHYNGNQLTSVHDGGTPEGFKDGTNTGDDYQYDDNGSMIADANKDIEQIIYNYLNLPLIIDMTEGRKIEYVYDAAGVKLAQRVYEDETQAASKVTDYIGERVYETLEGGSAKLQFIHHEEGRVLPVPVAEGGGWEYQYYLKDHLGNNRITFGDEKTVEYLLTMEVDPAENRIWEADDFENVYESEDNRVPQLNHTPVSAATPNPEYTAYLDGIDRVIGPAKSLKVLPGDIVEVEVYVKYLHAASYNSSVAGSVLLSGFTEAFINAGGELLITGGHVDEGMLSGLGNLGGSYQTTPKAYLNYLLFDKEYTLVSGGKLQIGEAGKFNVGDTDLGPHEYLHINPINIEKEGYIYIYLSNQTPGSEVYFDDLLITHTQSRIVQKNDYYPFGLSISALSSSRENTLTKKYLYNGKELQNELGLDWYDYGARFYDAAASRFFNIDPLSEYYYKHSPFNYAANNPIRYIDIYGLGPWDRIYFSMSLWGTPYKQELTSNLRTGNTTEALAYSDCSEHICRILAYDGITEGVEWMNTSALQEFFEDDSKFKEIEINDLQPGDFVIWSGHTALFTGYNDGKSRLYLSHSQNWLNTTTGKMETGTYENSWRKGYFKTKKAKFYRPKKENPDRHVFLGRKMDELLIEGKQTNRPRPISPQFKELQIMNQKNLDRYLHPNRLYKGDEGYNNSYWDLYDTLKEWGNEKKK